MEVEAAAKELWDSEHEEARMRRLKGEGLGKKRVGREGMHAEIERQGGKEVIYVEGLVVAAWRMLQRMGE